MQTKPRLIVSSFALLAGAAGFVSSVLAQQAPKPPATQPASTTRPGPIPVTTTGDEVVQLSPFQVSSDAERGYQALNTLSGTRLNSKLEDLGASITVITKQQMFDTAALDLNDIFLYEAGTEGIGTYTQFDVDRNGSPTDNSLNPNGANRVRGVGAANLSFANFETSGRMPVDPSVLDAVEISRGPNSTVFGLGNAAGTVNMAPASANLSRNRSTVGMRWDSFDGYRGNLDLNRVLLRNKLAIRGSAVFQHDGYVRKPSGTDRNSASVWFQCPHTCCGQVSSPRSTASSITAIRYIPRSAHCGGPTRRSR